ncbi:hypothetical protein [Agrococcus sp. Marseille-P2731]|uniref:hypothetical protein n=1 Tax=Agrococcus sp. Marseille-P2731 TaxID=1841862 RepID=UPI001160D6F3|nr:hypothetical protein [Agrococcus sp. Marseille-P2731]
MDQALDLLNAMKDAEAASEVRNFDVWITGRPVRVELHDTGEGAGSLRYWAAAYSPDVPEQ